MPEEPALQVALVVVAQGEYADWEPLTQVQRAAKALAEAIGGKGYALELPERLQGGNGLWTSTTASASSSLINPIRPF